MKSARYDVVPARRPDKAFPGSLAILWLDSRFLAQIRVYTLKGTKKHEDDASSQKSDYAGRYLSGILHGPAPANAPLAECER